MQRAQALLSAEQQVSAANAQPRLSEEDTDRRLGIISSSASNVPVFDKSVDYLAKVREQSALLREMQGLHEDHSVDFLGLLKELLRT